MKKAISLAVAALMLAVIPAAAGTEGASKEDLEGIRATALNYVNGWYEGNEERMEKALHHELAKRIVRTRDGGSRLDHMGAMRLVQYTRAGYGKKVPVKFQQRDVEILDVFGSVASVRVTMHNWIDYMHMARWDGEWVIVNVLWENKPKDKQWHPEK